MKSLVKLFIGKNTLPFIFAGLFFSFFTYFFIKVNEFLDSEEIESEIISFFEENYAHLKINMEGVETSFRTRAFIHIKNLLVQDVDGTNMLEVEHLIFKIPYYTILSREGRVSIDLNYLTFYRDFLWPDQSFNFETIFSGHFLDNDRLRFDLRLMNFQILDVEKYYEKTFDRIIVKNLGRVGNSAFELSSDVVLPLISDYTTRFNFFTIGEFSLDKFFEEYKVDVNFFSKISNITIFDQYDDTIISLPHEVIGGGILELSSSEIKWNYDYRSDHLSFKGQWSLGGNQGLIIDSLQTDDASFFSFLFKDRPIVLDRSSRLSLEGVLLAPELERNHLSWKVYPVHFPDLSFLGAFHFEVFQNDDSSLISLNAGPTTNEISAKIKRQRGSDEVSARILHKYLLTDSTPRADFFPNYFEILKTTLTYFDKNYSQYTLTKNIEAPLDETQFNFIAERSHSTRSWQAQFQKAEGELKLRYNRNYDENRMNINIKKIDATQSSFLFPHELKRYTQGTLNLDTSFEWQGSRLDSLTLTSQRLKVEIDDLVIPRSIVRDYLGQSFLQNFPSIDLNWDKPLQFRGEGGIEEQMISIESAILNFSEGPQVEVKGELSLSPEHQSSLELKITGKGADSKSFQIPLVLKGFGTKLVPDLIETMRRVE